MATSPVPAPSGPPDPNSAGPGPGGGFSASAPPQSDPKAAMLQKMIFTIVSSSRMIAQQVPAAMSEVRQINDLVSQIQSKIVGNQPKPESQAPPV